MPAESKLLRELFFSGLDNPVCKDKVKEGELVNVRNIVCMSTFSVLFDVILYVLIKKDHSCLWFILRGMFLMQQSPAGWILQICVSLSEPLPCFSISRWYYHVVHCV